MHKALKAIRQFHNKSQKDLADDLGISPAHLCWIEKGKKPPSLEILNSYSKVFSLPLSSILYFAEESESQASLKPISEKTFKMLEWMEIVTRH